MAAVPAPRVFACLGAVDGVPVSHLAQWLTFHRAVGIDRIFVANNSQDAALLHLLAATPNVTVLDTSFAWSREVLVAPHLHAKHGPRGGPKYREKQRCLPLRSPSPACIVAPQSARRRF
jgi:hypothetical protein